MKKQIIWIGIIMAWMLCACNEEDKLMYDQTERSLNLWFGSELYSGRVDSMVYNYAYRPLGTELDSIQFYVKLIGKSLEEDGPFELEVVGGDSSSLIEGKHYQLPVYVLKAGVSGGYFPIYFKNTSDLKNREFTISLALKTNDWLTIGTKEYSGLKLIVKDREEKPIYWDNDPEQFIPLKQFFGTYSLTKYQFMIKVIGKAVTRVIYRGKPTAPGEVSYAEALYLQEKCRVALVEYNNNPDNPDRPLSDEYGPISF